MRGTLLWAPTALLGIAALACTPPVGKNGAAEGANGFDLTRAEIVDLSHSYGEDTLYWPSSPTRFELRVLAHGRTEAGFFYSANSFSTPEHGGTHLDAPIHFAEGGWTADEIPLERLIVPAAVVDVSTQAAVDPDYRLTVGDIAAWESEHGAVPAGAALLLRTGWDARWPDALRYLGDDTPGDASPILKRSSGMTGFSRPVIQ